jgi:hypothetical protein
MLTDRAKKNVDSYIKELQAAGKEIDAKDIAQELSYTVSNVKEYLNVLFPSAGRLPVIPTSNSIQSLLVSKTAKESGSTDPDTVVIRFNLSELTDNVPAKKNANKKTGATAKIGYNKGTKYIKIGGELVVGDKEYFMQPTMLVYSVNKDGILDTDFVETSDAEVEEEVSTEEVTA